MKSLLSTRDLSAAEAIELLDTAEDMARVGSQEVKKLPTLRGRAIANLFFEDSTRTRTSFELAEKRLSADVINFSGKGSSLSKGESLKDTAQTIEAMGIECMVVRHPSSGAPARLAASGWVDARILNAGDGTHEHPSQALLDAFTLRARIHGPAARGRDLAGVSVLIAGDVLHSRVARSNLWLLQTLGAKVLLVAPPTLMPSATKEWPADIYFDLDEALRQRPDAVMMLRVQSERMLGGFFPNEREYSRRWGLNERRFRALPSKTLIMHPGPMNRGLEICAEAADSNQSTVLQQVANGVAVRMAILYLILAGAG